MTMLVLISSLVGAVLGTRCKVYALLPITLIGFAGIAIVSIMAGTNFLGGLLNAALFAVTLQLGYVAGLFVRFCIAASRARLPATSRSLATRG